MTKQKIITFLLIMMSASMYSQKRIIQKTKIEGQNAVIISEAVMDSIMSTYYGLEKCKAQLLLASIEKAQLNLKVNFLSTDNQRLEQEVSNLKMQLHIEKQLHQVDVTVEKKKGKGKFKSFLYGTAVGGLVVAVLIASM